MSRKILSAVDIPLYSGASFGEGEVREVVRFSLSLREGEIATLQGDNQSGKSLLIKALTGLVPTAHGRPISITLCDKRVEFRSPADAISNGVVAVFQDDELIPHMTIRQQLRMRHASHPWEHARIINLTLGDLAKKFAEGLLRRIPLSLRLRPPSVGDAAKVDELSEQLLRNYSQPGNTDFTSILDRRPQELSGGAKAVARLVAAQLTPGIKVLLLDEIFRGLQIDVWPIIVDRLRAWAEQTQAAILVVTHVPEEVIRWKPTTRYRITGKVLTSIEPSGHQTLIAGVPPQVPVFPVYRNVDYAKLLESFQLEIPAVLVVDESVVKLAAYLRFKHALAARYGQDALGEIVIEVTEATKSWDGASKHFSEFAKYLPFGQGTVVAVGGGVLLNFVSFIASILYRGVSCVLMPTTAMAMADVAIGSKTSVNASLTSGVRKHLLGTYWNPICVIYDDDYIKSLSRSQVFNGLAECLKHGVLQDQDLVNEIIRLSAGDPLPRGWFSAVAAVCWRTMLLKSAILMDDPWEDRGLGYLLLYGHLHAHSIERASSFAVSHGIALYIGLLVDAKLSRNEEVCDIIRRLFAVSGLSKDKGLSSLIAKMADSAQFKVSMFEAYRIDPKPHHHDKEGGFQFLDLRRIGCFRGASNHAVRASIRGCTFEDIYEALSKALTELVHT